MFFHFWGLQFFSLGHLGQLANRLYLLLSLHTVEPTQHAQAHIDAGSMQILSLYLLTNFSVAKQQNKTPWTQQHLDTTSAKQFYHEPLPYLWCQLTYSTHHCARGNYPLRNLVISLHKSFLADLPLVKTSGPMNVHLPILQPKHFHPHITMVSGPAPTEKKKLKRKWELKKVILTPFCLGLNIIHTGTQPITLQVCPGSHTSFCYVKPCVKGKNTTSSSQSCFQAKSMISNSEVWPSKLCQWLWRHSLTLPVTGTVLFVVWHISRTLLNTDLVKN